MSAAFGRALYAAVVCGAVALCAVADEDAVRPPPASPPPSDDEIIVYGSVAQLRHQLLKARDEMFARFNDINSDDRFDIHCYSEAPTGSRIERERCVSNSWREQDRNIGQSWLAQARGETGLPPEYFMGEQAIMADKLRDEWRRLANEDPELADAMKRFGRAQAALDRLGPSRFSQTHDRAPNGGELPYGAQRVLDVSVGRKPWTHALDTRTFRIATASGEIRGLTVACDKANEHLEYRPFSEWTVPSDYGSCRLQVDAERGTAFTLYELP